jgi:hypothetical protein
MKSVLIYLGSFLLFHSSTFASNSKDTNVLSKHDEFYSIQLLKSQLPNHKFLVQNITLSQFATNPTRLAAGVIAVSPVSIYDNDVAGGGSGSNRIITIDNTGAGILSISDINITGANSGEFVLSGLPGLPASVNPASSISFTIAFNPLSTGLKTASVNITSDDVDHAVVSIPLRGLGTFGLGGTNEPSLQSILNLFEIPINVGDDDPSTAAINSSIILQKSPLLGEEVNIQHFQKAGSGNVTITPLAVFGPTTDATIVGMGWYKSGDASQISELFTISNDPASNGQTVNVNFSGTLSFDPLTDTFGFYSRWPVFNDRHLYSEDNLNIFPGAAPHHVRVYPYKDNAGVIPNTYLIAFEENIAGFDYQDIVFIVKNVKPATPLSNALLYVENLDKFPSNEDFVFSRIQIPWLGSDNYTYNSNHDSLTVRIHNKGLGALTISNLQLSDNTTWKIDRFDGSIYTPGAELPKTISSGSYVDLILKFIATNQATRVKVLHDTLTIISNDDNHPSKAIFLHGLWQKKGEGNNEPYAQEVIDAFGFKTSTGYIHTDPYAGDTTELQGDEIRPSYFVRANTSLPVSVTQMASYRGCCSSNQKLSWYLKGESTVNTLFTILGPEAQMLLPWNSSDSKIAASGTLSTSLPFGFKVGTNSTDAAINYQNKIGIRVWKAIDSKGNIIPNSYIIANDYLSDSSNYDYNDNLYYVDNIKPYIGTAFNSALNTIPSDLDFGEKLLQGNTNLQLNLSSGGKSYSNGSQDPPIVISSVAVTGENQSEFSASMPLKTILNPQENTSLTVTFKPVSQGLKIADLLVYHNNSQYPLRVPLYGIAKAAGVAVINNYQIKSGSPIPIIINGKTWSPDTQYAFDNLEPYSNVSLSEIASTDKDALYLSEQSSSGDYLPFRYEIPVPNGDYVIRLHFAETVWGAPGSGYKKGGPGSRVMSVKLEDQLRLINLDVAQQVGVASAVIKNLPVTVTDGKINIDFSASVNRPMVNGIEVYSFSVALATTVLDLKGNLANNKVDLEWTSGDGTDTKYFEVQRSINETDFVALGEIPSNITQSQLSKYNFTDNNPVTGNNYYRIKQIKTNGEIIYSKILRFNISDVLRMQLLPNPATKTITLQFSGMQNQVSGIQTRKANLYVQSSSGKTLKKISLMLVNEKIELDISSLSAGAYIITLSGDNFIIHKKFLKIK